MHKSIFLSKILLILDKQLNYIITATIIKSHYIIINLSIRFNLQMQIYFPLLHQRFFIVFSVFFFSLNYTSKQSKLIHYIHKHTHSHTHTTKNMFFRVFLTIGLALFGICFCYFYRNIYPNEFELTMRDTDEGDYNPIGEL